MKKIIFLHILFCLTLGLSGQTQKISRGDVLEIIVYNRPELSKTVIVREDGTVDYPFISGIPVDALSISEFRDLVFTQLAKYTGETPIITVQYSHRLSIQVVILGQVQQPGEIVMPKNSTIQGALVLAGGATSQAELDKIKVFRGEGKARDTLFVDLYAFSEKGDLGLLPSLQDGDVIFVPGLPGISDVKVLGEVRSPGNLTVPPGTSLLDVLFLAGGPSGNADLNRIRLYDNREKKDQRIYLDELIKENRFEEIPIVNPGNVIVVERKTRFLMNLADGLRVITSIAVPIIMIFYYLGAIDRR
ncbi:SLBB domain-containing protein [bacterium]|nr:SLBB domain-containing protein [bacterium]